MNQKCDQCFPEACILSKNIKREKANKNSNQDAQNPWDPVKDKE
jgi:hypothetical protein